MPICWDSALQQPGPAPPDRKIAMDGSQKLPQRMLDSVRWHLVHQKPSHCCWRWVWRADALCRRGG